MVNHLQVSDQVEMEMKQRKMAKLQKAVRLSKASSERIVVLFDMD